MFACVRPAEKCLISQLLNVITTHQVTRRSRPGWRSGAIISLTCFCLAASRRQAQPGNVSVSHRATRKARLICGSVEQSKDSPRARSNGSFLRRRLMRTFVFRFCIASSNEDTPIHRFKSASFFYPSRCNRPHH